MDSESDSDRPTHSKLPVQFEGGEFRTCAGPCLQGYPPSFRGEHF